jgi:hypothetical protein
LVVQLLDRKIFQMGSQIDTPGTGIAFQRNIEGVSATFEAEISVLDWLAVFNQTPAATATTSAAATPKSARMESSYRAMYLRRAFLSARVAA